MAAPVLLTDQSVPYFRTNQAGFFQPGATGSPTTWTSSPIAPGLTIDTASGRISGTPTVAGNSTFIVQCFNDDGASNVVAFCLRVDPAAPAAPGGYKTGVWDLVTNKVTFDGNPVLEVVRGDDLFLQLQHVRDGVVQDLTLTEFKLAMKLDETAPILDLGAQANVKVGSGDATVWRLYASLKEQGIADALGDEEPIVAGDLGAASVADRETKFRSMCELQMKWSNTTGIGPNPATQTSAKFEIRDVRDLLP
jgi:hypothetical protein